MSIRKCLAAWARTLGQLLLPNSIAFVASVALAFVAPQLTAALLVWWIVLFPLMVAFVEAPRQ